MILEGSISVKAALLGGHRKVEKLYADEKRHDKELSFILAKAREQGVPVERMKREKLDALASGRTHGGLLAEAGARVYDSVEALFKADNPFLVLLEGVEDPFNLGYVMRSLYAGGCTGLILNKRSWEAAEPVIVRSSAGASEYLPVVMADEPSKLVVQAKEAGMETFAAMRKDAMPCFEADFRKPVLIAIGGEMRGLSAPVLAACGTNIYIPYANDFRNALNAAGASAVLAFEVLRQRSYAKG